MKASLSEPVPDTSEPWTSGAEIYKVMPSPGAADAGDTGPENTREIANPVASARPTKLYILPKLRGIVWRFRHNR